MTLYTAVGRFESKTGAGGNRYPVVMVCGKEYLMDISEMLIWTTLNYRFLEMKQLAEMYDRRVAEAKLPEFKSSAAYIDRLLQRSLVVEGHGDTGHDALYDLLCNLYIIPTRSGFFAKLAAWTKLVFVHRLPLHSAQRVFRKEHLSAEERRVMRLARQSRLSAAELITCVEKGHTDVSSDGKLLRAIYSDAVTTSDNIGAEARLYAQEKPCLTAIANLYLRQQIIFERI